MVLNPQGSCAIHYAVQQNNLKLLDLVVSDYRGDMQLQNSLKCAALALAVEFNHLDCILYFCLIWCSDGLSLGTPSLPPTLRCRL